MFESYTNSKTKYADNIRSEENTSSNIVDLSNNNPNNQNTNTNDSKTQGDSWEYLLSKVFNKTSIFYLLLFLGIYIFIYFMLGFFFNKSGDNSSFQLNLSRIIDFIFLSFLLLFIVSYLYSSNTNNQQHTIANLFNSYVNFLITPTSILTTFLFMVVFYLIIYLFRIPTAADIKPIFISVIETISWLTLIIICIIDFFQYILGIPIIYMIYTFWYSLPNDVLIHDNSNNIITDNSNNIITDEVFNISNNLYTFDDAQAICKAYGAKLATYDEIEDAYNKGAEWCNYGWSDGQMAFFPTQKSTWTELQKDDKRKNNCGRPGINGGYIANPYLKFGVNCFGKKPQPSQSDLYRMNTQNIEPKTSEDIELDAKIQYWKDNAAKLLQINSYNKSKWSQY
jgi:hypothetical protein